MSTGGLDAGKQGVVGMKPWDVRDPFKNSFEEHTSCASLRMSERNREQIAESL